MKKLVANLVLFGLLYSMTAAQSENKKGGKKAAPPAPAAVEKAKSFDGWVSDEKCGANINPECTKKCLAGGAKVVFVGTDKTVTPVANPQSLIGFPGQHVNIQGKLENGVLTVASVKLAAQ